jgi:hypothetical protein
MKKERNSKSSTVFALSTLTHLIPKYHYDKDGNCINPDFNNRTYVKKAYKAYLKGQIYFRYKDNIYTVPKISKQALEDYLNSVSLEDLEKIDVLQELENIKSQEKIEENA